MVFRNRLDKCKGNVLGGNLVHRLYPEVPPEVPPSFVFHCATETFITLSLRCVGKISEQIISR